jgi:hypothetical protein
MGSDPDSDPYLIEPLGHSNTPGKGSATDTKVTQTIFLKPRQNGVLELLWLDTVGVCLNVCKKAIAVVPHAEEVALLLDFFQV